MELALLDWNKISPSNPETTAAEGLPLLRYPHREEAEHWNRWNRDNLMEAEKAWSQVLQTQPDRLDLILALSQVEQALGRFEAQYTLLSIALRKIDKKDGTFQWIPGQEVPDSPQSLLSNVLLDSQAYWFSQGPEKVEYASRLARLAMTYNERDPLPYNALAVCRLIQGNPEHALKCLLIALNRDGTNCIVLGNIGRLLASIGKRRAARIYFRRVVSLNRDADETSAAKRFLAGKGLN
jgi:tetratricopeptide (TPR) repeat protein